MSESADNILFEIDLSEFGQDFDVEELTDDMLLEISGGKSNKPCPHFTRRVCGTYDGVYKCVCVPK